MFSVEKRLRHVRSLCLLVAAGICALVFLYPAKATAANYNVPPYYNPVCTCCALPQLVMNEMFTGTGLFTGQNDLQQYFYIGQMFRLRLEPALKDMTDDFRGFIAAHAMMVGAFIDGQATNTALATVGKLNAETLKSYQVSDQICRFGTLSRSLAQSQDKSKTVKMAIMEQVVGRQLMRENVSSGSVDNSGVTIGRSADKAGRWKQYKQKFCDKGDAGGTLDGAGYGSNPSLTEKCESTTDVQLNRDIDMTRTLDAPNNLKINFITGSSTLTPDEENIMALASNLYAHDLPINLGKSDLEALNNSAKDNQVKKLMDFRSVVAKRSVAANSFAAITGMKAEGAAGSKTYLQAVAAELGLASATDITRLVGDNPSYYAQMDFLAKRLYQSPNFYVNLYDSPANVERQKVALKAIDLMQDRDIYESLQRSEMLLSTLLELQVMGEQNRITNKGVK